MGLYSTPSRSYEDLAGRVLSDLDKLVEDGHDFFEKLEEAPWASLPLRALSHARLVTHEWLANLVQHADFDDRTPLVTIRAQLEHSRLRFVIDDNSSGFDFYGRLKSQAKKLGALPNRGMGLLMIGACSDELAYQSVHPSLNRLVFTVGDKVEPTLEVSFSEPGLRVIDRPHAAAA